MVQFPLSPPSHPELEYLRQELRRPGLRPQLGRNATLVQEPTKSDLSQRVTAEIQARRSRERRFGATLFSDPVWDMLLALYQAHLQGRTMSATELCIASGTPASVALRWISVLDREGLLDEADEAFDRRRSRIKLAGKGIAAMSEHFESTAGAM